MQLGAVHEVNARGENGVLLLLKLCVKLGSHGRFNAHLRDVLLRGRHGGNHLVGAVGCTQIEAQLVQTGLAQGTKILFRGKGAVGVHVLVDARFLEGADHAIVHLDLHKGLQVYIRDARGLLGRGEQ